MEDIIKDLFMRLLRAEVFLRLCTCNCRKKREKQIKLLAMFMFEFKFLILIEIFQIFIGQGITFITHKKTDNKCNLKILIRETSY